MLDTTRSLQIAQESLYLAADIAGRTDTTLSGTIETLAVQVETIVAQLRYALLAGTV